MRNEALCEMETRGLIDDKNFILWDTLRNAYDIEVRKEQRSYYSVCLKNEKAVVYVPYDNLDPASFAHELLHIFLKTKGVHIDGELAISIRESRMLSNIISESLVEHIGNCLDHILMYPDFIRLGYKKNEFIADYSVNKLTDEEINFIKFYFTKRLFFKRVYNSKAIDSFIGKYFAVNACPNDSYNYKAQLNELKEIDIELFQVLEFFLIEWIFFDYNDTDPITGGYHLFLLKFIENLEIWTTGKSIQWFND